MDKSGYELPLVQEAPALVSMKIAPGDAPHGASMQPRVGGCTCTPIRVNFYTSSPQNLYVTPVERSDPPSVVQFVTARADLEPRSH